MPLSAQPISQETILFFETIKSAFQAGKVRVGQPAVGGGDRVTVEAAGLLGLKAEFLSKAEQKKLSEPAKNDAMAMKAR